MDKGNKKSISVKVSIPADEDGYTGRECPICRSYFKIVYGTGLKGITYGFCPHCGYKGEQTEFVTEAQFEYARSIAVRAFTDELVQDLKQFERKIDAGFFTIEMSVQHQPYPIKYYREQRLETHITCANCTLKYAVYGVYGYCPDCGQHNSQQILEKNLEISRKMLDLVQHADKDLAEKLPGSTLDNLVAAFDGFGREVCRVYAVKSADPMHVLTISFQNLTGAQSNVRRCFGFDIAAPLDSAQWDMAIRLFQKRHVVEHRTGVIDDDYIARANDPTAIKGRKVSIAVSEINDLIDIIKIMGAHITTEMQKLP